MKPALRVSLLIIAALAVPLIPFVLIGELPGERWLSAHDDDAVKFALYGAALLAVDVILPIPSSLVGTMLGARLGFVPGTLAAFLGLSLGQFAAYGASRWLLRRHGQLLPSAPTALAVFLSRPVPVLAEALALAAGAGGLHFARFALACAAGNLLYAVALAGNGAALLPQSLAGPGLIVPMLLPACAWLAWRWLRARQDRTA